jgi:hypothetical protein
MMQPDQPRPQLPPCPVCGADGTSREWRGTHGDYQRGSGSIHIDARQYQTTEVKAVVCTRCGYIMLFADPQQL